MKKKNILFLILVLIILGFAYCYTSMNSGDTLPVTENTTSDSDRVSPVATGTEKPEEGKLKVINFSGKLEEVNTGCFADGECYIVVDKKHVTTTRGWSQEIVGTIQGVDSFGDLESHIGEKVEVYAKDNGDGTYTLYGSNGFYVKLVK